jgi:tRNA (guanine37-N1)-methyltransferase
LSEKITLLEYPQYTRPSDFEGKKVPEIMLSGDPKKIRKWQLKEAYVKTKKQRPDLLTTINS